MKTAAETNEIAQVTAVTLHEQSEQLERIQGECQQIESNLDTSQYLIKGMKSWWGAFTQIFTTIPEGGSERGSQRVSEMGPSVPEKRTPAAVPSSNNSYNNEFQIAITEPDSIDHGLTQLHDMLGEMKERAVEIGKTLDHQNVMLDSIHQSVETSEIRMNKQKRDLDTLLKRK